MTRTTTTLSALAVLAVLAAAHAEPLTRTDLALNLVIESSIDGSPWRPVPTADLRALPDGRLWLPYQDRHVTYRLRPHIDSAAATQTLPRTTDAAAGTFLTLRQSPDLDTWRPLDGKTLAGTGTGLSFPLTSERGFWQIDSDEVIPDPLPLPPLRILPDPDASFVGGTGNGGTPFPAPPGGGGYLGEFTDPPSPVSFPGPHAFNKYIFEERVHQIFEGDVKGYAVVLANEDGFQAKVSGGWARDPADGGLRMSTTRPGNIGSVAKLYSGVALMQLLAQQGPDLQTALDQAIGPFLPARWLDTVNDSHEAITFRQLLNHTSGLSDLSTSNAPANLQDNPSYYHFTLAPGGTGYRNENYRIMTYLIPRLAYPNQMLQAEEDNEDADFDTYLDNVRDAYGLAFESYMRDDFFPQVAGSFAPSADPANDYTPGTTALMYSNPSDTAGLQWSQKDLAGFARAQGGYWSSAQELARFMRSVMYTNDLLAPADSQLLATSPWLVTNGSAQHAGFTAELGVNRWRSKPGRQPSSLAPGGTGRGIAMFMPYDWVCSAVINSESVRDGANSTANANAFSAILGAFFDATRDQPETISRAAMTIDDFMDTATYLRERRMEVTWLDLYDVAGTPHVNAVFGEAPEPVAGLIGMNADDYQAFLNEWVTDKGFAIQQVESYLDHDKIRYAAIITEEDRPEQRAYHGWSYDDHVAQAIEWRDEGFVPVNVSVVSLNGQRRYTAFYEKRNVQFSMQTTLDAFGYDQQFETLLDDGMKVVSLNAYRHGGKRCYAAIWHKIGGGQAGIHEADRDAYRATDAAGLNNGRLPTIVTGVDSASDSPAYFRHLFGAVWR